MDMEWRVEHVELELIEKTERRIGESEQRHFWDCERWWIIARKELREVVSNTVRCKLKQHNVKLENDVFMCTVYTGERAAVFFERVCVSVSAPGHGRVQVASGLNAGCRPSLLYFLGLVRQAEIFLRSLVSFDTSNELQQPDRIAYRS